MTVPIEENAEELRAEQPEPGVLLRVAAKTH